MQLFSRIATLGGSPRRAMPWAIEVTAYVNAHTGLNVTCWAGNFGAPIGTVGWSTMVESQSQLAAETAKLTTDGGYLDLLDAGAAFITAPGVDHLRDLVHGTPPAEPAGVGAVATVTTATALFDRMVDALGWGVEVAQYGEQLTGSPVAVFADVFGQMGTITWIAIQPDLDAAAMVRGKLMGDPGYLGRMPATKDLFIAGSGHTAQLTRIA